MVHNEDTDRNVSFSGEFRGVFLVVELDGCLGSEEFSIILYERHSLRWSGCKYSRFVDCRIMCVVGINVRLSAGPLTDVDEY